MRFGGQGCKTFRPTLFEDTIAKKSHILAAEFSILWSSWNWQNFGDSGAGEAVVWVSHRYCPHLACPTPPFADLASDLDRKSTEKEFWN